MRSRDWSRAWRARDEGPCVRVLAWLLHPLTGSCFLRRGTAGKVVIRQARERCSVAPAPHAL